MDTTISSRLDIRLANLLRGIPFSEWCEQSIDNICPDETPVDLSKYFSKRKIINVSVNSSMSFPAKLIKSDEGFSIHINKNIHWNSKKEFRFIIAHEIAHTFQYLINDGVLIDKSFFLPGSIEAEYFGNRIARSILLPRKLLLPFLKSLPDITDTNFSLKCINDISQKFNVSHTVVIKRLINDLNIFNNIALFRFVKFPESPRWRLFERYLSNSYNNHKKYFIPYRNMKKGDFISTFPSCHTKLNDFLCKLDENLEYYKEVTNFQIDAENLADKPLLTFIKNFKSTKFRKALLSKAQSGNSIYINMLLTLDPGDIIKKSSAS